MFDRFGSCLVRQVPTAAAELDAYRAAAYVARHTMAVLEELFTEAR